MVLLFYNCFGFLVSKNYKVPMSCFQGDMDPISMVFKILLDRHSGIVGTHLSKIVNILAFHNYEKFPSNIF